jgi:hypothetical protein
MQLDSEVQLVLDHDHHHSHLPSLITMHWEKLTMDSFEAVPLNTSDELEWYGPWNMILGILFPHHKHFEIAAQHLAAGCLTATDYMTFYIIKLTNSHLSVKTPVFFIEVKPFPNLDSISS